MILILNMSSCKSYSFVFSLKRKNGNAVKSNIFKLTTLSPQDESDKSVIADAATTVNESQFNCRPPINKRETFPPSILSRLCRQNQRFRPPLTEGDIITVRHNRPPLTRAQVAVISIPVEELSEIPRPSSNGYPKLSDSLKGFSSLRGPTRTTDI